ncbi:hypothetical protein OAN95_05490 [Alphaproteobacteria bacterium]|nr:hypothetical protein [Alphaproteobacteria bacterium]
MTHYVKILASAFLISLTFSLSANAAVEDTTAVASTACNATGTVMIADGDCRATPSTFSTNIYEIGLCTAHPYGAAKTSSTFDASTCVVIYTDAAPAAVDLAAAIGTNTTLPGTASAPTEGTYGFPYIKLGTDFTVAGSLTNTPIGGSATTYYSIGSGNVNTTGPAVAQTDSLRNFDKNFDGSTCTSGYLGAAVVGGTMDGFITDASFARSDSTEVGNVVSELCDKSTRLVAVMNLSAPFTVTSQTYAVNFNFVLTNYGAQFIDGSGSDSIPDEFGSAPFAGYFTVLNAD